MPLQIFLTHLLNSLLAVPVARLLAVIGHPSPEPSAPINGTFTIEFVAFLFLVCFFLAVRATLSVERPGAIQQLAELVHEFVSGQAESIIGHGYERFVPYITVILLFIVTNNLLGLIPDVDTPTANASVPLGLALLTFVYYHFHGLRENGPIGYLKQFLGPVWWIAPLMLPIEIISHFARVLSLTVRLFANMLASDLLTLIFFSLFPFALPLVGLGLHLGVSLIQAYVFMLLAAIYLGLATSHEH